MAPKWTVPVTEVPPPPRPRRERSLGDAPCGGCVRPEESCELATKGTHVCDGNSWADQYRG